MTEVFGHKTRAYKFWARVKPVVATCLLTLTALPFIFFAAFGDVKPFDDEGTLMITFRELSDGRILYHDMSTLYGPFYYLTIASALNFFNIPLSHDAARFISATFWVCCSFTFAMFAWRLSSSAITRAFALLTALFLLKLFALSALHPQELSFLLIGILLHILIGIEKKPNPIALMLLGAIVGGLLLTKVNLAAFITLPLILGALRTTGDQTWLRPIHGILSAIGLLMPVVLMAPLFRLDWVIWYCVFSEGTILAALMVWSSRSIPKTLTIGDWRFAIGGSTLVVLLTIGATMAGGTTAIEILRATVLQNFGLIQNWYNPAPISGVAITATAISTMVAVLYASTRATKRQVAMDLLTAVLKAGIGSIGCLIIAVATFYGSPSLLLPPVMFDLLVPFA